jgi:CHAD domain-containing protein
MAVDQERSRLVFRKLSRQLSKLGAKPAPESVHKFRTCSRRVEALLDELILEPNRNDKKLLRELARLRGKAGRVRDLDVQIACLRSLKISREPARKTQLLRLLAEERARCERRLLKAFSEDTVRELRQRLKRAARAAEIPAGRDALGLAMHRLAELRRAPVPLTEKIMHQYRIVGKRARYLAELDPNDPRARSLVEQLKRMQDAIGDWHDWLKLTLKAEKLLDEVPSSPLLAALRNVTRAKFRQAVDALSEMRVMLSAKKPVAVEMSAPRKPVQGAVA